MEDTSIKKPRPMDYDFEGLLENLKSHYEIAKNGAVHYSVKDISALIEALEAAISGRDEHLDLIHAVGDWAVIEW